MPCQTDVRVSIYMLVYPTLTIFLAFHHVGVGVNMGVSVMSHLRGRRYTFFWFRKGRLCLSVCLVLSCLILSPAY